MSGVKVTAELFDPGLTSRFRHQAVVDVGADAVVRAGAIPPIAGLSGVYFIRLRAEDAGGKERSRNFYWLSTRDDELDWRGTKWFYTPTSRHGDLRALAALPPTRVNVATRVGRRGSEGRAQVTVTNPGTALAFQVRLKLIDPATNDEVLPVYWDDNYFELFPGESRTIDVSYPTVATQPRIEVEGWNVTP